MGDQRACLADWLDSIFGLSKAERTALDRIESPSRAVRRGSVLRRENERSGELMVVRRGWLYSSVLLPDGNRQILRLFFPGEVAGLSGFAFANATETLVAVTDAEICTAEFGALRSLFGTMPRLTAMMLGVSQMEQVCISDRLAAVGRLPARGRVAALIAEIYTKCRRVDPTSGNRIHLALTQEEIGDATGLTAVHVNRMLRSLAEDGYIARDNSHVVILDEKALRTLGNYNDRQRQVSRQWLPETA